MMLNEIIPFSEWYGLIARDSPFISAFVLYEKRRSAQGILNLVFGQHGVYKKKEQQKVARIVWDDHTTTVEDGDAVWLAADLAARGVPDYIIFEEHNSPEIGNSACRYRVAYPAQQPWSEWK